MSNNEMLNAQSRLILSGLRKATATIALLIAICTGLLGFTVHNVQSYTELLATSNMTEAYEHGIADGKMMQSHACKKGKVITSDVKPKPVSFQL